MTAKHATAKYDFFSGTNVAINIAFDVEDLYPNAFSNKLALYLVR